jgi:transketolase
VISDSKGSRQATLIATGSEVSLAIEAQDALRALGIDVAVVSMPCFELFAQQSAEYRTSVLGDLPRIGIEAALEMGWSKYLRETDVFIGMTGFGASAPIGVLFEKFGITQQAIVEAVKRSIT